MLPLRQQKPDREAKAKCGGGDAAFPFDNRPTDR
jgi:hypothetical protein